MEKSTTQWCYNSFAHALMNIPQPTAGNRGILWMGLQWIQGRWGKRVQSCWSYLASRNCHQTIGKPSKVTLIAQLAFNNGKSACWRSGDRLLQRGQSPIPTTEVPPLDHFYHPYFTPFLTLCTHELWCHYAVSPLNIMGLPLWYDILINA